jgi:hypothetical protein
MIYFDSLSIKLSWPHDPMIMFNWLTRVNSNYVLFPFC